MKSFERSVRRGSGWGREWSTNNFVFFYRLVYKYFYYTEKELKRQMAYMEPNRRFHKLIWDTIVSDINNHTGML